MNEAQIKELGAKLTRAAEIGTNFADSLPFLKFEERLIDRPNLSTVDVENMIGGGSTFDERRAFEWAIIGRVAEREGDAMTASYCEARLKRLHESIARGETL